MNCLSLCLACGVSRIIRIQNISCCEKTDDNAQSNVACVPIIFFTRLYLYIIERVARYGVEFSPRIVCLRCLPAVVSLELAWKYVVRRDIITEKKMGLCPKSSSLTCVFMLTGGLQSMVSNLQLLMYQLQAYLDCARRTIMNDGLWEEANNKEKWYDVPPNLVPSWWVGSGEGHAEAACGLVGWVVV